MAPDDQFLPAKSTSPKEPTEKKDPDPECANLIEHIDALLACKSLKYLPEGSSETRTRDYSLLKAHSNPRIRSHYLLIYAECLRRIKETRSKPYDWENESIPLPRWVILRGGLKTIERIAKNPHVSHQVTVESPSFMLYMALLHDLAEEQDQMQEVQADTSTSQAPSSSSPSDISVRESSLKKTDPIAYRFERLDDLILKYHQSDRDKAWDIANADWIGLVDRFNQLPEYTETYCCTRRPETLLVSRSTQWAIATLETPCWEALQGLSPDAKSLVFSHLDSRWAETVEAEHSHLFPTSKDSHELINYWHVHHRRKRERADDEKISALEETVRSQTIDRDSTRQSSTTITDSAIVS